jgi:hypothetical protein
LVVFTTSAIALALPTGFALAHFLDSAVPAEAQGPVVAVWGGVVLLAAATLSWRTRVMVDDEAITVMNPLSTRHLLITEQWVAQWDGSAAYAVSSYQGNRLVLIAPDGSRFPITMTLGGPDSRGTTDLVYLLSTRGVSVAATDGGANQLGQARRP